MSLDQLHKELKSGKIHPVYVLHGEEGLLIDQGAALLENSLLQEHEKAFDQLIIYGMDAEARSVREQLSMFPLMAPRRVIIIREAQQMSDLKDLESYVAKPAPGSVLVICHKGKSIDKRTKFYEALKKNAFILSAEKLKSKEVLPWLLATAKSMQLDLGMEAAQAMIELIGEEMSLLHPELKKLAGQIGQGKPVTSSDIVDLVGLSREYNVFELQNALEASDIQMTMRIGSRMSEQKGYSIIPLIALLSGFYTRVYAVKSLGQASDEVVAGVIDNKNPFLIRKAKDAARRYSLDHLEHCLQWLQVYDMKSKGWNYSGGDDRALTIELLDHLLFPDRTLDVLKAGQAL